LAQGVNLSGTRVGAAFTLPAVAWLVASAGWRNTFFILGAGGILWAVVWFIWFRDAPENHAGVAQSELIHIASGRGVAAEKAKPLPAAVLWRSPNLLLAMGQYFASCFTFFFSITWLFPHLQRTYELDAVQTGLFAAAPLLGGAVGNWVGGALVNALHRRGYVSNCYGYVAIAGFLLAVLGLVGTLTADNAAWAVAWLTLAIFGSDMTLPPSWAFCIAIGGPHSGVVSGMMNMAGNIGCFVSALAFPYMLGAFGSTDQFFIAAIVLCLGAAFLWTKVRPDQALNEHIIRA
jgi:ACS family glucarate transporter-like MFS transporter